MPKHLLSDFATRQKALDPTCSFIVQAPAGSGKTSLLVERYLTLLAQVTSPEEILALTFTRKAAHEMRTRIINTLKDVVQAESSANARAVSLGKLAAAVLNQDQKYSWHLLQNPNRLRIQTIDAFCYALTAQAPIASRISSTSTIVQNQEAEFYYHRSAQGVLNCLMEPEYKKPLTCLLLHLDNDWERVENLLVVMLKSREQWLGHIVGLKNKATRRQVMEETLARIGKECIEKCSLIFPKHLYRELQLLLKIAQENFAGVPEFFAIVTNTHDLTALPLTVWQDLARLLLTKNFMWRKIVTKEHGFPAPITKDVQKKLKRETKARMHDLLEQFSQYEDLRQNLENLLFAPPAHYSEQSWEVVESLLELLPLLVAYLKIIFSENSLVDYSEISQAAERLLGEAEQPSSLALNLDYRIQHLLVDEFQDTSLAQFRLVEKLLTTWQADDGRTFFAVGDPMQSIYRFREAEVGLFLRVSHEGIANLRPRLLTLTTNFRSSCELVNWINDNFYKILPIGSDISLGAVPFVAACGTFASKMPPVAINLYSETSENCEAQEVVKLLQKISATSSQDSIAILVRSRNHLVKILSLLRKNGFAYQAHELETLAENMVIRDLYALTRALFDLSDRVAWIAILRAPWCGLTLADLHKIANFSEKALIWEAVCDATCLNLSNDGMFRLQKFCGALSSIIEFCRRITWRELISKAWLAIGGPATIADEIELEFVDAYLELLKEPLDITLLQQKLLRLYTPTTACSNIHVMTIHKAKGLEFDHVILPGANRGVRGNDKKLLLWFERPRLHHGSDLLLAPIAVDREREHGDSVYQYLQTVEHKKNRYEIGRLLYVAMTRAKKSITVMGSLPFTVGSLLEQLKPCYTDEWLATTVSDEPSSPLDQAPPPLVRLTSDWCLPVTVNVEPSWHLPSHVSSDTQAKIIGTVIHSCLRMLTITVLPDWNEDYVKLQQPYWRKLLIQHGYLDVEDGLRLIQQALSTTLNDQRGRWLLSSHTDAASELSLTSKVGNELRHYIIDRTFITKEGVRWIIDYKTSSPNDANKKAATTQLFKYADLFATMEPKLRIKLGIYFPLCGVWSEVSQMGLQLI